MKLVQDWLMSSSMARTAPASCTMLARVLTDSEAPTTNTRDPSLRIPTAERHTKVALPTVAPHVDVVVLFTSGVIAPWSTSRPRFWRTAATSGPGVAPFHLTTSTWPSLYNTMDAAPLRSGTAFLPSCQ